MNRNGIATAIIAGAVALGAGAGTGLHAIGIDLPGAVSTAGSVTAHPPTTADDGGHSPTRKAKPVPTANSPEPTKTIARKPQPSVHGTLHLLSANEVGRLNSGWTWATVFTSTDNTRNTSFCQQQSLTDLGATSVRRRGFVDAADQSSGDGAGQSLATFASAGAAQAAYQTMTSWRDSCAGLMRARGYSGAKVGQFRPVRTNAEKAGWWLGIYTPVKPGTPSAEGWFGATGLALDGNTVTLLWIDVIGTDYNYDTGAEPMARTLVNVSSVVGVGSSR